jgi:hypothetical protein
MNKRRLGQIEDYVLGLFKRSERRKLLTREVFDGGSDYANADLVRAFEALEKQQRMLVRYTEEGNDWLQLTPAGVALVGLPGFDDAELPPAPPHPPKSSP